MTTAFVLSGGGNYGPLQAGALQALLEKDIHPDLLIGVSAGALNSAWLASHPDLAGVRQLQKLWRSYAPQAFRSINPVQVIRRLVAKKNGVLSNARMLRMLRSLAEVHGTYGRFKHPRLFSLATRLVDGEPRFFGDDPADRLLDGLMASSAVTPLLEPWEVDGVAYIDGGATCELPLRKAMAEGADLIYALNLHMQVFDKPLDASMGVLMLSLRILFNLLGRQDKVEIEAARAAGVPLHVIDLSPDRDPDFWDFGHADELIEAGYRQTLAYLNAHAIAERR
jgi:NTE family protein